MATEDFNGTNGQTVPQHNASWATPTGGLSNIIVDGAAGCADAGGGFHVNYFNDTFSDAHRSQVLLTAGYVEYGGPAIRVQSASNSCYYAIRRASDGVVFVGELISSVGTNWGSVAGFDLGDEIGLEIDGSIPDTVHLTKNGAIVETFTGKNAISGGRPGIATVNATGAPQIDSWIGENVASGGTPGNASGTGQTALSSAPTGEAGVLGDASGSGVTASASAPDGTAGVAVVASGDGVTDTATAPAASAAQITVTITGFRLIGTDFAPMANLTGITALIYKQTPPSLAQPDKIISDVSTDAAGVMSDIAISDIQSTASQVWLSLLKDGPPNLGGTYRVTPVVT